MIVKDGSITECEVENLAAKLLGLDINFVSGSEIQERFELDTEMKFSDFVECMRILGSNKLNLLLND